MTFFRCFLLYLGKILLLETSLICHQQIFSLWTKLKFCNLVKNSIFSRHLISFAVNKQWLTKTTFGYHCICTHDQDQLVIPFFLSIRNRLPDNKILDSSKLREFADDNFKFDKNGRKLSKRVENTVGKG